MTIKKIKKTVNESKVKKREKIVESIKKLTFQ